MRRLLFAFASLVAFAIAGCGPYDNPLRPARKPEYHEVVSTGRRVKIVFTCETMEQCEEDAKQVCPTGFDVESTIDPAPYVAHSRYLNQIYTVAGSMTIRCDADKPEVLRCDDAWSSHVGAARWWARRRGAEAREDTSLASFMRACEPLPASAQRCLDPSFRQFHERACDRAMNELAPIELARLDGVLTIRSTSNEAIGRKP